MAGDPHPPLFPIFLGHAPTKGRRITTISERALAEVMFGKDVPDGQSIFVEAPDDIEVVSAHWDPIKQVLRVVVQSAEWKPSPEGGVLEEWTPIVTLKTDPPPKPMLVETLTDYRS